MKTLRERTEIQQAFLDGEIVRYKLKNCAIWFELVKGSDADFDWQNNEYEIKPKPMEIWVNVYYRTSSFGAIRNSKEAAIKHCEPEGKPVKFVQALDD